MGCILNAPTGGCRLLPTRQTLRMSTTTAMPTTTTRLTLMWCARFYALLVLGTSREESCREGEYNHLRVSGVNSRADAVAYGQNGFERLALIWTVWMAELFDAMTNANAIYDAYDVAKRESNWKGSVQRYGASILLNILDTKRKLRTFSYEQKPFVEFTLHERGKIRRIKSMHIADRVVQRSICDNVLTPSLTKYLIYDNAASLKDKGIDFTRNRLQCHLEKFIRKHGRNGYVLKVDFSKFFDNIDHDLAMKFITDKVDDPFAMSIFNQMLDSFKIDVSNLKDSEIEAYADKPFNLLTHTTNGEGRVYLRRSVGIGSQISQMIGVFYPTPIDTYCKTVLGCKFYGRYMDDIYIIHERKEFLEKALCEIKRISKELKLFVNLKKTHIAPLKRGFTFLQIKYDISETGKVSKRLCSKAFGRERRKLKKYSSFIGTRMSRREIANAYQSWRGNAERFKAHRSVRRMDAFYNKLFVEN